MKTKTISDWVHDTLDEIEETEQACRELLAEGSLSSDQRSLVEHLLSCLAAFREQSQRGLSARQARIARQQPSRVVSR